MWYLEYRHNVMRDIQYLALGTEMGFQPLARHKFTMRPLVVALYRRRPLYVDLVSRLLL